MVIRKECWSIRVSRQLQNSDEGPMYISCVAVSKCHVVGLNQPPSLCLRYVCKSLIAMPWHFTKK